MLSQTQIEELKLAASIATPLAIAIVGWFLNRTIQNQNAVAQRQSSWHTKWADDFLKTASEFNESATSFIMLYYSLRVKADNNFPEEELKLSSSEILPLELALERVRWEISKFAGFAPLNGKRLEEASEALLQEALSWMKNRGGNVQEFRQKQLTFNTNARNVHAELLGFQDKKGKRPHPEKALKNN